MRITIPSTGQTITIPDGTPQADIDEAVDTTVKNYKPVSVPPQKAGVWDTIVSTAKNTAKQVVGMGELAANQVTQLGAFTVAGVPASLGAMGAEITQSIVKEQLPTFSGFAEKFHENMNAVTYQPQTAAGQQHTANFGKMLTAIPAAVDAVDAATGDKFKRNFPNTYAATQVAGEFAPFIVGGKMVHGISQSFKGSLDVVDTLPVETKATPEITPELKSMRETMVEQGVPEKVADVFIDKASKMKQTPDNIETLAGEVDNVIETARKEAPVTEEPPVKPPEYKPIEFTPEERNSLKDAVDQIINEDGTVNENMDSLINLSRVDSNERQAAIHQAIGETVRAKVEERLGKDSGKFDEIQMKIDEEIIKRNGRDTGMDFLKNADKQSLDLQRIAVESQIVRQMAARYVKLVDAAAEKANKSDATEAEILYYAHVKDMASQYVSMDAEIARQQSWALNARKIGVDGEAVDGFRELTPEDFANNPALVDQARMDLEKQGGMEAFKQMASEYLKASDLAEKIGKVKGKNEPSMLNVLTEARGFSLLSSVYGRTRDTIHNIFRPLTDDITYGIAATVSKIRGREGSDITSWREVGARFLGDWQGTLEAVTKTEEAVKQLPTPELQEFFKSPMDTLYNAIEKYESFVDDRGFLHGKSKAVLEGVGRKYVKADYIKATSTGKIADSFLQGIGKLVGQGDTVRDATWKLVDLYGTTMRSLVYGTIKYTDLPSEYMGYNSEIYGLATKTAMDRGMTGERATAFVSDIVTRAKAIRDDIKLPESVTRTDRTLVKDIHEAGMKASLERTLKNEFEGEQIKSAEAFINHSAAGKVMKLAVNQFFSTTARLIQFEMQRNLVTTWASKGMRESLMGVRGARAQDLATAKVLFGTMAHTAAIALVTEGVLVAFAPSDQRKSYRDAGIIEYGLNINGRLYQINQTDPYGGFLSSVAAAMYAGKEVKNEGTGNYLQSIISAMVNDRLERSWLKSLLDLKGAVQDMSGQGWNKYLMNFGTTLLPMSGFISSTRDMFGDGEVRAANTFGERIAKLYSPDSLDIEPDQYGKPRHTVDRTWGVQTSTPTPDGSARSEIVKHGIKLPDAPGVLPMVGANASKYGYNMTPQNQRDYLKSLALHPIKMEERLQQVIDGESYQNATPQIQKEILSKLVASSHDTAKKLLFKNPEILNAAKEKGKAIGELYKADPEFAGHENWYQFLTQSQDMQRSIMNKHGLKAQERK